MQRLVVSGCISYHSLGKHQAASGLGVPSSRFFETMEELEAVLMTLARCTDAESDFLSGLIVKEV